jgi:GTP cyclohydrolase III
MMHTSRFRLIVLALLLVFIAGCGGAAADTPEAEEGAVIALKITGSVNDEVGWSEEEIHSMESIQVDSTNNEGESETYTGVQIWTLLSMAGIKPDASMVVFIGGDGETAEVALSEVQDCENCIFTLRKNGGFSVLVPGVSKKLLVKGVTEVQIE